MFILIMIIYHRKEQCSLISLHRLNTASVLHTHMTFMIPKCSATSKHSLNSLHFWDLITSLYRYEHKDTQIRKVPIQNSDQFVCKIACRLYCVIKRFVLAISKYKILASK